MSESLSLHTVFVRFFSSSVASSNSFGWVRVVLRVGGCSSFSTALFIQLFVLWMKSSKNIALISQYLSAPSSSFTSVIYVLLGLFSVFWYFVWLNVRSYCTHVCGATMFASYVWVSEWVSEYYCWEKTRIIMFNVHTSDDSSESNFGLCNNTQHTCAVVKHTYLCRRWKRKLKQRQCIKVHGGLAN